MNRIIQLKGKLGKKKWHKVIQPQTNRSLNRQFSPKSPEVGQKSRQRVQNEPNKNQTANLSQKLL